MVNAATSAAIFLSSVKTAVSSAMPAGLNAVTRSLKGTPPPSSTQRPLRRVSRIASRTAFIVAAPRASATSPTRARVSATMTCHNRGARTP